MIPMLILYAIRRLKGGQLKPIGFLKFKKFIKKVVAIFCLMVYSSNYGSNPSSLLVFNIIKNDVVIGTIKISERKSNDSIIYNIESKIEAQFILKFKVVGKEKYIYKNGTLIYSSLFRTLNKKVKTNHSITYNKGQYNLQTPEKVSPLNFEAIKQNLMTLYITEPIGIEAVFCVNQKQMVKVQPMGDGIYKVELSKGKYNVFHYKNGRCTKIEAVSPMFDVTLIPVLS
jgi:hypothetical protein